MPLQTRNVVELLSLQPGVTTSGEVLGSRRDQNNITLDGADVNNNQNSGLVAQATATGFGGYQGSNANGVNNNSGFNAVLPIPLDSVQEFRVTVAGEGPNLGRSSGGQVSLVTKSGTNQLHGSLYEYNRNTAFAANTWFNNYSPECPASLSYAINSVAPSAARSSPIVSFISSTMSSARMPVAYLNSVLFPRMPCDKGISLSTYVTIFLDANQGIRLRRTL